MHHQSLALLAWQKINQIGLNNTQNSPTSLMPRTTPNFLYSPLILLFWYHHSIGGDIDCRASCIHYHTINIYSITHTVQIVYLFWAGEHWSESNPVRKHCCHSQRLVWGWFSVWLVSQFAPMAWVYIGWHLLSVLYYPHHLQHPYIKWSKCT